jgi:uncharacterized membrane protein YqjE
MTGHDAPRGGIFAHFAALLAAKLDYLRARLQLLGLEGKEAAIHYGIIAGLAIGALVAAVFGYLFFVIAFVFFIAWLCGGGNAWIAVALVVAVVHFGAAAALAIAAKWKLEKPVFSATIEEFRKDQEWLQKPANPS